MTRITYYMMMMANQDSYLRPDPGSDQVFGQIGNVLLALFPIVLVIGVIVLTVWPLVDIAHKPVRNKALWVVVILGIPWVGGIGYLVAGRKDLEG